MRSAARAAVCARGKTHCQCPPCTELGGAFLRMPLGFELERRIGGWCGGGGLYASADAMFAKVGT